MKAANESELIVDFFTKQTVKAVVEISSFKGINFDKAKCNEYFNRTGITKLNNILTEVRKDAKTADFFNGLNSGRIDPLTKKAADISFLYGITEYAKEILEFAKI